MNLYIWAYKAKVQGGRGFVTGRVEAPTYSHAEQAIKQNNLMVNEVQKITIDRSPNARQQKFEAWYA
jgi:type II secretory pathway component PulF